MWSAGLNPGDAFDAKGVEPAFDAMIKSGDLPKGKALIPGCGRGYAVAALAAADCEVTGLEISDTAKAVCEAYLTSVGATDNAKVIVDDFFTHSGLYDFVYDCTFLCAIPPRRRTEWAAQMAALIKPGGEIVSLVFPIGDFEGGPPFALSPGIVKDLLVGTGKFEAVSLLAVPESQWARGGPEFLYRWKRIA